MKKASGNKCARCWRVLDEVKSVGGICLRCEDAVREIGLPISKN